MKKHFFLAMACMMSVFATAQTYQNPVIDRSLPDPTVIKGTDGAFYLYSTEDIRNVPVYKSNDLIQSLKPDAKPFQVAGTAYEGTYIHKRDGYYYLFASTGTCCEGVNSTYATVVGRSTSLFGPYEDLSGRTMLDNHHEVLIAGNDQFKGTGHNSEIVTDAAGNDWLFYHAVSVKDPKGRKLLMDQVHWVDGWPVVFGNQPSSAYQVPKMN